MNRVKFASRDVLDELDNDARQNAAFFPDFDHGYCYHVDGRLTAYGDTNDWVVIVEQLSVNPRRGNGAAGISLDLYFHGNSLTLPPQPGWGEHRVLSIPVCADGPSGPLEDASLSVAESVTDLRIRDVVVPVRKDQNYYWARKIEAFGLTRAQIDEWIEAVNQSDCAVDVKEQMNESYEQMRNKAGIFDLQAWDVARGLIPEHRELLLSTDAERRRGVPSGLPQLLQIEEWDHPRLMEDELPSNCESFKLIAKVLASGDLSLYRPTEPPNTHWSNWPISGSL